MHSFYCVRDCAAQCSYILLLKLKLVSRHTCIFVYYVQHCMAIRELYRDVNVRVNLYKIFFWEKCAGQWTCRGICQLQDWTTRFCLHVAGINERKQRVLSYLRYMCGTSYHVEVFLHSLYSLHFIVYFRH